MSESLIKCVVPVSGGKDSQACLELALQRFDRREVVGLFCDTRWEHPKTYEHVRWMERYYGIAIDHTRFGSVPEKAIRYGRFPSGVARFCTDELKIRPTKKYLWWLATLQGCGFEVWYGMRSQESKDREKRYQGKVSEDLYPPHMVMPSKYPQYLGSMGVMFRLPILEWSTKEVFGLLAGRQNPLYETHDRVGCAPCWAGGDAAKEAYFNADDFGRSQMIATDAVANIIGKSIWTSKSGKARNFAGCGVCSI